MLFLLAAGGVGAAIANSNDDDIKEAAYHKGKAESQQVVVVEKPSQTTIFCPEGYACNWETKTIIKLPKETN